MAKKKNDIPDQSAALVKRVWSFCNILRDEGVGAGEYFVLEKGSDPFFFLWSEAR